MFKSIKVAVPAALSLFSGSFMLAYGAPTATSAQAQSFQAPVVVAPAVATPVEPVVSNSAIEAAPAVAAEDAPDSLAELVDAWQDDGTLDAESRCLATAIFFESKSESLDGQLAVANVVLARAQSGRFAKTLCGVVTQPGQFGFVRSGRMPDVPEDSRQWHTARAIAQIALDGRWKNPVEGALYFHATYSGADWDRPRVAKIGRHVFYR
jgi:spore germination cell wall hydrolase CwlJ-like protein